MARKKPAPPKPPDHPLLTTLALRAEQSGTKKNARAGWPWWAPLVIEKMAKGAFNLTGAALEVGVGRTTVYRLKAKDPEFSSAVDEARESSLDLIERQMVEAATKGIPSKTTTTKTYPDGTVEVTVREAAEFVPTAGFFMLKRWRPEYRDSFRAELTGADGGPVRIESIDVIDRRIAELAEELRRRGRSVEPRDLVEVPEFVDAD